MTHEQIKELIPLYALDALEAQEISTVEAHVESCPDCATEADESRAVAAALVPDASAPSGVWDRVVSGIDEDAQGVETPPPPISLDARRAQRFGIIAAVAATLVLLLAGVLVSQLDLIRDPIAAAAERAATEPGAIVDDFVVEGQPVAKVILTGEGRGFILPSGELPSLSADRAYQLWVINDVGDVISAGVLGHQPAPATFTWTGGVSGFALTREVAGGVVSSAGDVVSVITDV
jgi:anti-sigma-K factor RskA